MLYEVKSRDADVEHVANMIEFDVVCSWRAAFFQYPPYTTAMVWRTDAPDYVAVRSTKINWPDKWDSETGRGIALRRAVKAYLYSDPLDLWVDDELCGIWLKEGGAVWDVYGDYEPEYDDVPEAAGDLKVGDILTRGGVAVTVYGTYDGSDGRTYYKLGDGSIITNADLRQYTILTPR
jgi:hypothetical protein